MYKMNKVSKEAYKKCEVETIDKGQYFRVSRRDLQIQSGCSNWAAIWTNMIEIIKNTDMNSCPVQNFDCVKDF